MSAKISLSSPSNVTIAACRKQSTIRCNCKIAQQQASQERSSPRSSASRLAVQNGCSPGHQLHCYKGAPNHTGWHTDCVSHHCRLKNHRRASLEQKAFVRSGTCERSLCCCVADKAAQLACGTAAVQKERAALRWHAAYCLPHGTSDDCCKRLYCLLLKRHITAVVCSAGLLGAAAQLRE